jgi:hypothetical protein
MRAATKFCFPFGSGWQSVSRARESHRLPFIEHCTVSGIVLKSQRVWVLDGTNNDGFSGGRVVVQTGIEQRGMAVVSGCRFERVEVIPVPTGAAETIIPTSTELAAILESRKIRPYR